MTLLEFFQYGYKQYFDIEATTFGIDVYDYDNCEHRYIFDDDYSFYGDAEDYSDCLNAGALMWCEDLEIDPDEVSKYFEVHKTGRGFALVADYCRDGDYMSYFGKPDEVNL